MDPGEGVVITEADLPRIEEKMVELSRKNSPYVREEIGKEEVLKLFRGKGDQYKVELIEDLQDGTITLYKQGNFTDLCRGPHVPDTRSYKGHQIAERCRRILARGRKTQTAYPYLRDFLSEKADARRLSCDARTGKGP